MAVDPITGSTTSPQVAGAIRQAAQSTGISFEYLLTTARIESNLNPAAQASTSSAKGLYQFIDQTWLGTMKQDGAALGYGKLADAITRNSDGRYEVADSGARDQIMKLRSDPAASAMLAGAFTRANAEQVGNAIGRTPSEGELYLAHFLGPEGAGKLINAATSNPSANAATMFPSAAAANQSIFYDRSGTARSVGGVYARLTGKFESARAASFGETQVASVDRVMRPPASVGLTDTTPVARVPDTAGTTQVLAAANASQTKIVDTRPLFQAMFSDRAGQPVASVVNTLWGKSGIASDQGMSPQSTPTAGTQTASNARGLDLFSDGGAAADIRALFGRT